MRNVIVVLISFGFIGLAVYFTILSIQGEIYVSIPIIWILMLCGAGEAINVGIVKPKKKGKNDKKERH